MNTLITEGIVRTNTVIINFGQTIGGGLNVSDTGFTIASGGLLVQDTGLSIVSS